MKNVMNTELQPRGGGKPSSNASLGYFIKRFFESLKKKCRELSLVNSKSTSNKQILSSRINEVHCGILEKIKRCRNSLHSCGKTLTNFLFTIHKRQLTKFAFTLAETLVVMGIIGVVAALTIPNLNQSTGDREKVAKVKKIYQNLTDAFDRAQAVYGSYGTWFTQDTTDDAMHKRLAERMTEFMKISKSCGTTPENCFANKVTFLGELADVSEGLWSTSTGKGSYNYILADGTSISIGTAGLPSERLDNSLCTLSYFHGYDYCASIVVDIDGIKGPSEYGKDIFMFTIYEVDNQYVLYPNLENSNIAVDDGVDDGLASNQSGIALFSSLWIIENDNMDYLKIDDNGKCPNGKVLDWTTNTSCK